MSFSSPGECCPPAISSEPNWSNIELQSPWYYFGVDLPDSDAKMTRQQWLRHKSWLRHLPEPRITFLLVCTNLLPELLWVTLITIGVGLYYHLGQLKNPGWVVLVSKNYSQPFVLTSFALAMLLVFRTNSSYDRWWNARKHIGQMYNDVRSIARLTMNWIAPKDPELAGNIIRLTSALGPAGCSYIAEDVTIFDDLCHDLLSQKEFEFIRGTDQPPISLMLMISALFQRATCLDPYRIISIEDKIVSYQVQLGMLERIRSTPVYIPYTRHTSRFLLVYLTFLPFGTSAA